MATEKDKGEGVLRTIVQARLTSVQFVLNYLVLGFDDKGALTTLVWPEIISGEEICRFGMKSYRDRLCELIEHVVAGVDMNEQEIIEVLFTSGEKLRLRLRDYQAAGERAIFTAPKGSLYVW